MSRKRKVKEILRPKQSVQVPPIFGDVNGTRANFDNPKDLPVFYLFSNN